MRSEQLTALPECHYLIEVAWDISSYFHTGIPHRQFAARNISWGMVSVAAHSHACQYQGSDMGRLKAEIAILREDQHATMTADVRKLLQRSVQRISDDGLAESAAGVGDKFPYFSLPNAGGDAISSEDLLARGPLVVSFYRGGWCPYCNLELRAFQAVLDDIRELGAEFVAISPQMSDESLTMDC